MYSDMLLESLPGWSEELAVTLSLLTSEKESAINVFSPVACNEVSGFCEKESGAKKKISKIIRTTLIIIFL